MHHFKVKFIQKNARLSNIITCQCDASKHIFTASKQSDLKEEIVRVIDRRKHTFLIAFNEQNMTYIRVFTALFTPKN